MKKSQPECNDSEGTASESEIERPTTKKVKCAAKTAPTPAAPQNKKKVAALPNKKDLIPDSVLGDAGAGDDAPSESDDSDLYEGGEDGAVEQKQDTEDEPWKFGELPKQHPIHFTSASGPQTPLNPDIAQPIDYFYLFVPITWFSLWAQYTNSYAEMRLNLNKTKGKGARRWTNVTTTEIMAWIGTIIYQCLLLNLSSTMFWNYSIDFLFIVKCFPSMLRWQQIKRFFKCSDPNTEEEEMQKGNRLVKVQAFFDAFIQACKTFYLAAQCIALDEAIKAFNGRCLFKHYIK